MRFKFKSGITISSEINGSAENLVRTIKHALMTSLGERDLTDFFTITEISPA